MSVRISTPASLIDTRDRLRDLIARVLGVLVPADRDRGKSRQVADDRLGRVHQLRGELPVRDDDDANHRDPVVSDLSRITMLDPQPHALDVVPSDFLSASAIITDRCCPPVQPIATVR